MRKREFKTVTRTYILVARGDVAMLDRALDMVQAFLETSDPLVGMVEVHDCVVTIRYV